MSLPSASYLSFFCLTRLGFSFRASASVRDVVAVLIKGSRLVYLVDLPLIQVDQEHDVVSETTESMHGRHPDDHRKQVVNKCADGPVDELPPRQIRNRLVFVIDKNLRRHQHEAKTVHARRRHKQEVGVPTPVT